MRGILAMASMVLLASILLPSRVGFGRAGFAPSDSARRESELKSIQGYRKWVLVTPTPVDMAPVIAMSCVGASPIDSSADNPHPRYVFKVYVNPIGKEAMGNRGNNSLAGKPFPVGSMIVKEKYVRLAKDDITPARLSKDAKPEILTAMVKREKGFDPKNGDWEYLALAGDAATKLAGKTSHCAECHRSEAKTYYVFGAYGSGFIQHGRWPQRSKTNIGR